MLDTVSTWAYTNIVSNARIRKETTMKAALTFRVYKINGTKCIRKFDNLEEAQSWVWVHEDLYRVDWVEPALTRNGYTVIPERKNSWNNRYVA